MVSRKPARIRHFIFAGSVCAVAAVTFAGLGAVSLLAMLHVPRFAPEFSPDAADVQMVARDRAVLKASWLNPRPATGALQNCVLVLHGAGGTRSRAQRFVPFLRMRDYAVLAPDMRAHGESGGDMVTYGVLEKYDAIDWAHWMRARGCGRIYAMGESLGASVLIEAAAVEPVFTAIVAECPYADLLEEAEYRGSRMFPLPFFLASPVAKLAVTGGRIYARLAYGIDFGRVLPVESMARLHTPVLLIHGTDDTRTPPSHSGKLAAANPLYASLWLVPGARHVGSFRSAPEEYRRRVLAWFADHP